VIITVCATCALGQGTFPETLRQTLAAQGLAAEVRLTDCMSGCTRASTLAFRTPGKTAYLFGDLSAKDLPDLITFARLYAASPDGTFSDARPLGSLRTKALARIPGQERP
jgi:predicted metal-binding protein